MRTWLVAAALLAAVAIAPARAATLESEWEGVRVRLTYPEKVTFDTPFDLRMEMDGSVLKVDAIAFRTRVGLSDSVLLDSARWGTARWRWQFETDDASFPMPPVTEGLVGGPPHSEVDSPAGGMRQIRLFDPYSVQVCANSAFDCALVGFGFTWLYRDLNEKVRWTLENLVIRADTDVELLLDDENIVSSEIFAQRVLVLDPPPAIPEPQIWALLLLSGLALVGSRAAARRGDRSPELFGLRGSR